MHINKLAKIIINVLTERHDAAYVENKIDEISDLPEFKTLAWLTNLDGENLEALATKLGVTSNDLKITISTVKKIINCPI